MYHVCVERALCGFSYRDYEVLPGGKVRFAVTNGEIHARILGKVWFPYRDILYRKKVGVFPPIGIMRFYPGKYEGRIISIGRIHLILRVSYYMEHETVSFSG